MSVRALVVERVDSTRRLLAGFLSEQGLSVTAVASSAAAIEAMMTEREPEILVLSLAPPIIESVEVLRWLGGRSARPGVVLVADERVEAIARLWGRHEGTIFTKPVNVDRLLEGIVLAHALSIGAVAQPSASA